MMSSNHSKINLDVAFNVLQNPKIMQFTNVPKNFKCRLPGLQKSATWLQITPYYIFANTYLPFRILYPIFISHRRKSIKLCSIDEDFVVVVQIVIKLWWSRQKISKFLHSEGQFSQAQSQMVHSVLTTLVLHLFYIVINYLLQD